MYKLISLLSVLVRNQLPNPFESMERGTLINWCVGTVLAPITFSIVGLFYERGSEPAWGSLLYLFFYLLHTGIVILCGKFGFTPVANVTAIVLYCVLLSSLVFRNKIR